MSLKLVTLAQPSSVEVRRKRLRSARPDELLMCRCGGTSLIVELTNARYRGGKVVGGTKQWLCAACLLAGQRVVVML